MYLRGVAGDMKLLMFLGSPVNSQNKVFGRELG